jgi:hypothetical protein
MDVPALVRDPSRIQKKTTVAANPNTIRTSIFHNNERLMSCPSFDGKATPIHFQGSMKFNSR